MNSFWPHKDPDEVLDYAIDWAARLIDGETVTASEWELSDASITIDDQSIVGAKSVLWLSGGTLSRIYAFTNRIMTSAGRTMDKTVYLNIRRK